MVILKHNNKEIIMSSGNVGRGGGSNWQPNRGSLLENEERRRQIPHPLIGGGRGRGQQPQQSQNPQGGLVSEITTRQQRRGGMSSTPSGDRGLVAQAGTRGTQGLRHGQPVPTSFPPTNRPSSLAQHQQAMRAMQASANTGGGSNQASSSRPQAIGQTPAPQQMSQAERDAIAYIANTRRGNVPIPATPAELQGYQHNQPTTTDAGDALPADGTQAPPYTEQQQETRVSTPQTDTTPPSFHTTADADPNSNQFDPSNMVTDANRPNNNP